MSKKNSKIPFSQIFHQKENLVIIFSDDIAVNYRIASKILQWGSTSNEKSSEKEDNKFKSVYFLFPDFQKDFFKTLFNNYPVYVDELNYIPTGITYSVVVNLNNSLKASKKWSKKSNTVILGVGKQANVTFLPPPNNPETIIENVAGLLHLPALKVTLDLKQTEYNPERVRRSITDGKALLIINSFWKRNTIVRRLSKESPTPDKLNIVVAPTKRKWFFSKQMSLNLKEIVAECYHASKIFTDDPQIDYLLDTLGFKLSK